MYTIHCIVSIINEVCHQMNLYFFFTKENELKFIMVVVFYNTLPHIQYTTIEIERYIFKFHVFLFSKLSFKQCS